MSNVSEVIYDPFLPEKWPNPIPAYKVLLENFPVYYLESRNLWILSRYDDVMNALKDWRTFSSAANGNALNDGITRGRIGNTLGTTDPPKHDQLRRMISSVFTPKYVANLEPEIREIVKSLISNFKDRKTFDIQQDFSYSFTAQVVGKLIGIPQDKVEFFVHALSARMRDTEEQKNDKQRVLEKFNTMANFCMELVEMKKSTPGNDVISQLLNAEIDGERMGAKEVAITANTLIGAAFQSTAMAIGCAISTLSKFPNALEKISADHTLIPQAIEELLRYDGTTIGFKRTTTRDVELHGKVIPRDSLVFLNFGAANHDERFFDHPEKIDIYRKNNKHLGFGWGVHMCLGAPLARVMIRIAFEELLPILGTNYNIDYEKATLSTSPQFRGYVTLPIALR